MAKLMVCKGLPGSGKTTWSWMWQHADRLRRVRVNRDELRRMLIGGAGNWSPAHERIVATLRDEAILTSLFDGYDVVSDDMNLDPKHLQRFKELAHRAIASIEVVDQFLSVPLEECLRRQPYRPRHEQVPEHVIRDIHARWVEPLLLPSTAHDV